MQAVASLLNPGIVWALIPLGGIALSALRAWLIHQERMTRIRAGLDPERAADYER
ncbi:MAG: hypothetical protein HYV16_13200 [Gammaproteobacteria bacterium]|nr:hypothetical protein [Gammaproteobacteria bacterium]